MNIDNITSLGFIKDSSIKGEAYRFKNADTNLLLVNIGGDEWQLSDGRIEAHEIFYQDKVISSYELQELLEAYSGNVGKP